MLTTVSNGLCLTKAALWLSHHADLREGTPNHPRPTLAEVCRGPEGTGAGVPHYGSSHPLWKARLQVRAAAVCLKGWHRVALSPLKYDPPPPPDALG